MWGHNNPPCTSRPSLMQWLMCVCVFPLVACGRAGMGVSRASRWGVRVILTSALVGLACKAKSNNQSVLLFCKWKWPSGLKHFWRLKNLCPEIEETYIFLQNWLKIWQNCSKLSILSYQLFKIVSVRVSNLFLSLRCYLFWPHFYPKITFLFYLIFLTTVTGFRAMHMEWWHHV